MQIFHEKRNIHLKENMNTILTRLFAIEHCNQS